jgi:hypothetical protein
MPPTTPTARARRTAKAKERARTTTEPPTSLELPPTLPTTPTAKARLTARARTTAKTTTDLPTSSRKLKPLSKPELVVPPVVPERDSSRAVSRASLVTSSVAMLLPARQRGLLPVLMLLLEPMLPGPERVLVLKPERPLVSRRHALVVSSVSDVARRGRLPSALRSLRILSSLGFEPFLRNGSGYSGMVCSRWSLHV